MKTKELSQIKDLNIELLTANRNLISYLIQVYKRNGITYDEFRNAEALLLVVSKVLQKIDKPTNRKFTRRRSTDDYTEP